jgi:hypothetical protein
VQIRSEEDPGAFQDAPDVPGDGEGLSSSQRSASPPRPMCTRIQR